MDLIEVQKRIEGCIEELDKFRDRLTKFVAGKELARATAVYDKEMSIAIVEQGGEPVGIRKELAKGVVSHYKEDVVHKEITYKAILTNIAVLEKQLNGWQSVFRYMQEV